MNIDDAKTADGVSNRGEASFAGVGVVRVVHIFDDFDVTVGRISTSQRRCRSFSSIHVNIILSLDISVRSSDVPAHRRGDFCSRIDVHGGKQTTSQKYRRAFEVYRCASSRRCAIEIGNRSIRPRRGSRRYNVLRPILIVGVFLK